MSISTLVRYAVLPALLGWGTFAAILITGPGGDDLSAARFATAVVAWLVVQGAASAGMFFLDRKRPAPRAPLPGLRLVRDDKGPDCERCGKPTRKPFLYRMPNYHWRCEDCERAVTEILFTAAQNGTLTESMLSYTRPFPTDRTTEK